MNKFKPKPTQPRSASFTLPARCACCLSWPDMLGAAATYTPNDGGDPIPYVLCPKCAQSAMSGDKATIKAIESYLMERTTADQP